MNPNPIYLVKDTHFKVFQITEFPRAGDFIVYVAYGGSFEESLHGNQASQIVAALASELQTDHGMKGVHVSSETFKKARPNESFPLKL